VKKILIIRFSSIGDIVLTTPVIRCLKQSRHIGMEIHYLTKINYFSVLEANPYIYKIHCFEKNISEIIPQLKSENFDFVIDLHHNIRSSFIRFQLRKPSASFNKLNVEKWLLVNFKINRLPNIHIVDRYMETLKTLDIQNDNKGLDYFIPAKDEVNIQILPIEFHNGYIGFVIGGTHATKRLPDEKIISICKRINAPIILLGGKEDYLIAEKIAHPDIVGMCYNACGKYNINQSASLVRQATKIITHDTGLMHIAAAFKKDIISVWGNTIPEFGMSPYMAGKNSKIVEVKGLSCRPCSKLGFEKCPKRHFNCMNLIDEEEIASP